MKCQKGHMSLRVISGSVFNNGLLQYSLTHSLSDKVTYRAVWGQLKTTRGRHCRVTFEGLFWPIYKILRVLGSSPNESPRREDSKSPPKSKKKLSDTQVIGRWKKYSTFKINLVGNLPREDYTSIQYWIHPASWKILFGCWNQDINEFSLPNLECFLMPTTLCVTFPARGKSLILVMCWWTGGNTADLFALVIEGLQKENKSFYSLGHTKSYS